MGVLPTAKFFGKLPGIRIGKVRYIPARKIGRGSGAKTTNIMNKVKSLQNVTKEYRNRVV